MKAFATVASLALAATASAIPQVSQQTTADARDSAWENDPLVLGPQTSSFVSNEPSFVSGGSTFSNQGFTGQGQTFSNGQGHSFYNGGQVQGGVPDQTGFNFGANVGSNGLNANVGGGLGIFAGDILTTGVMIIAALMALTMVIQIIQEINKLNLFDGLLDILKPSTNGRSMSSDDMVYMANMVMEAYNKFEDMQSQFMNVPK